MAFPYPALRSTIQRDKRVQVDANACLGPAHMPQSLEEAVPGIRLALAASIQPFEQRAARQMHIQLTALSVVRNRLVVQMTLYPHLGSPEQFARGEEVAVSPEPICKLRERLPQFLA